MPSSSFTPNGQYAGHGAYPSRNNSGGPSPPPFSGQFPGAFGQQPRGRGKNWGGSGQPSARNGANGASFPPKMVPTNDFSAPQYPVLYQPHISAWDIISITRQQVEYYLSIENLCKDVWLRKHMDDAGFVPLSVIAGFRRIQELTKDYPDALHWAVSSSDQIEFGVGDDGINRLRRLSDWEKFVFQREDREESARNAGPRTFTPIRQLPPFVYAPPVAHPGYHGPPSAGLYTSFPDGQAIQASYVNGAHGDYSANHSDMNGHHYGPETQLSAVVPEYAPPLSPLTLENMTNVTDPQVQDIVVLLSYNEKEVSDASEATDVAGYMSKDSRHIGINGVSPDTFQRPR